jgi:hypothetical protein
VFSFENGIFQKAETVTFEKTLTLKKLECVDFLKTETVTFGSTNEQ